MKKFIYLFTLLFSILILSSCSSDDDSSSNSFIGIWDFTETRYDGSSFYPEDCVELITTEFRDDNNATNTEYQESTDLDNCEVDVTYDYTYFFDENTLILDSDEFEYEFENDNTLLLYYTLVEDGQSYDLTFVFEKR